MSHVIPKRDDEKADLLGERVVGGATEIASVISEELEKWKVGLRDQNSGLQFIVEVIAFYMHLVDRMAFAYLGPVKRQAFGNRFMLAVLRESLREIRHSPDTLSKALQDTYNSRQIQYARYKKTVPEHGEPLKDTLFWEFGKVLFAFTDSTDPAILAFLNTRVLDLTAAMVGALKVEEVLVS